MQETTKKKKAPILCAAIIIAALAIFLACIVFPLLSGALGQWIAVGILLLYGGLIVAVIVGVVMALRQRLREIDGGEEEDAKKY